jgi:hypothetical protein
MNLDIFNPKDKDDSEEKIIITSDKLTQLDVDTQLELFEAQCREISKIKYPIKRLAAIKNLTLIFSKSLRFSEKDVTKFVAFSAREEERRKIKVTWDLKDIVEYNVSATSDIIPGIFRDGGLLYIFGGKAKTGKSVFLYYLASCVALGKECLGRPVKQGLVDIYQLEEPPGLFIKRLQESGFDNVNPQIEQAIEKEYLRVHTDFNVETDLQELKEYLLERKPRLVILDSFRASTRDSDVSENSAEFGKFAYALQRIASLTGVTIIAIHHLNKSADPSKGADGLSGTGSLAGGNDGMAFVYPASDNYKSPDCTHVMEFLTIPREGLPVHLIVGRDSHSDPHGYWRYKVLEQLNIDPAVVKFTNRILSLLCRHIGELHTKNELASKLGIDIKDHNFNQALSRLVDGCQITRTKKKLPDGGIVFYFSIDQDNPWPEYFKGSRSRIAELAEKAMSLSDTQAAKNFVQALSKEDQNLLWTALEDSERNKFIRLYSPPAFLEGTWVRDKQGDIKQVTKLDYKKDSKGHYWLYELDNNTESVYAEEDLTIELDYSRVGVL